MVVIFGIVWMHHFLSKQKLIQKGLPFYQWTKSQVSVSKRRFKIGLQVFILALFLLSLARPQWGRKKVKVPSQSTDIVIVLDVSWSMLAEDMKPSRLELAKKGIERLLDRLQGERVGFVAFAGSAEIIAPLTMDIQALKIYLNSLSPYSVSQQGTHFEKGMNVALRVLEQGRKGDADKSIIFISDGEAHHRELEKVAQKLKDNNIWTFAVGVGGDKATPIPVRDGKGARIDYRRDKKGKIVLTRFNSQSLKVLSQLAQGDFYHLDYSFSMFSGILERIKTFKKSKAKEYEVEIYKEGFQYLLVLLFIVFCIEWLLSDRKKVKSLVE